MYELIYSDSALKELKKLERKIQKRILNSLERIRIRPHSYLLRLVNNPYFRLRVGDYRIILDVKDEKLIIFVIELGHRKEIYQ